MTEDSTQDGLVDEAMAILDATTDAVPTRAHLAALHAYHTQLLRVRVTQVLRKLDCEHVHLEPCQTCSFVESQPEWADIAEEFKERRTQHGALD